MGLLQQVVKDLAKTGPDNLKKLLALAEQLPSDNTLRELTSTLNKVIPYIPQVQALLGDGRLSSLDGVLSKVPDQATLEKLSKYLPYLEKIPNEATLQRLLEQAESLKKIIDVLEEG